MVGGAAGLEPGLPRRPIWAVAIQRDHTPRRQLRQPSSKLGVRSVLDTDEGRDRAGVHSERRLPDCLDDSVIGEPRDSIVLRSLLLRPHYTHWKSRVYQDATASSWRPISRAPFFTCASATITTQYGDGKGVTLIGGRFDGTTVAASWE